VFQNEWWRTEKVKESLAMPYKREVYKKIEEMVNLRQIVVVTGLRRVGKTTIFYQLINSLIEKGIKPTNIVYFSFDEKIEDLKKILDEYQRSTGVDWKNEKIFVFFDEIHKLSNWSSQLKILYDNLPNIKFFVSGSSSVDLEKEVYSNLVGRHFLIKMMPLTLKEFFELKKGKKIENFNLWKDELFLVFPEYLKKPFPEIVNESDERRIMEYIKENIIGKIIGKDLPKKFGNINEDLLMSLIEIFYQNPGMILNTESLSKNLGIAKKTLFKYLFYLRFSYLIRQVKNFRASILVASRKLQKVYPYHWSLIFGLYKDVEKGKLLECIASSLLDAKFYWRKGNKEIDFILKNGKIIPVEVKAKSETEGLVKFLKKFNLKKGILFHEGKLKERKNIDGVQIEITPLLELAFYGGLKT
jgi:predicted AAA+ superfamily ATPase